MSVKFASAFALLFLCLPCVAAEPQRYDWPQWRGPGRANISQETGLLKEWPEDGPPLALRVEGVGMGIASIAVRDGTIYVPGFIAEHEYLTALDESTGKRRWVTRIGPAVREHRFMRHRCQRAPAVDQDHVYWVTGQGQLVCLRTDTGTEVWRRDYTNDFEVRSPTYGILDSPLVDGDRLICLPGGAKSAIVALNKKSGAVIWKCAVPGISYGAFAPGDLGGVRQYLATVAAGLVGVSAESGEILWTYPKLGNQYHVFTPMVRDNFVICASPRSSRVFGLKVERGTDGFSVDEAYTTRIGLDYFQDGVTWVGDHVFTFRGSSVAACLKARTGEILWQSRSHRLRLPACVFADGHFYLRSGDHLELVEANPAEYVKKGGFTLPEPDESLGSTFPIIANGHLLIRDDNRLLRYDIRDKQPAQTQKTQTVLLASPEDERAAQSKQSLEQLGCWPQWRGPNRDAVSSETGLLKKWPKAGPPLHWRVEGIGEGIASVSIAGGQIYTVGYRDGIEYGFALDQHTGKLVWASRLGAGISEHRLMRWLSQRSPTIDGDRVYMMRGDGDLICLKTNDGTELWRKSYPKEFDSPRPHYGFCDYPLVDGDRLVCLPGGPDASIVVLNKHSGEEIWRANVPGVNRPVHGAVVALNVADTRQYVTFSNSGIYGVAAEDGRILWHYGKLLIRYEALHTPVVLKERLLVTSGYGGNVALLKLVKQDGRIQVKEQWFRDKLRLDAFQDDLVTVGERVFLFGLRSPPTILSRETGEIVWQGDERVRLRTALVYADGKLVARRSDGIVRLLMASDGYDKLGEFSIPDHKSAPGATAPVIAGGHLYLRSDDRLFSYDIRGDALSRKHDAPTVKIVVPAQPEPAAKKTLRSVYVPTPHDVVSKMLQLAEVKKSDTVCDLGSGDGRILIVAAKSYGAKAIGYEIDAELAASSRENAKQQSVSKLVTVHHQDIFSLKTLDADVVTIYLLPDQLEKLKPLLAKLKPGTRVVTHFFKFADVDYEKKATVTSQQDGEEHHLYLWRLPLKAKPR